MTVDILSSIKGAKESESVIKLFDVIKNSKSIENNFAVDNNSISIDNLREDVVIDSPQSEKDIIIENFPKQKKGYLVVKRVIEE